MRTDPLRPWNWEDPTRKLWKAALKRAGKRPVRETLAPVLLALSGRITDADHSASDKSHSMQPSERWRVVVSAINELREGPPGPAAAQVSSAPGRFTLGVSGNTSLILDASVAFIEAMCASRHFEQHVLGCLLFLNMLDRELTEPLRQALSADGLA